MDWRKIVVIVAGGSGKRMKTEKAKQFLSLHEKPVLMHTIQRFYDYDDKIEIRLVLPENQVDAWRELCKQHNFSIEHRILPGGETRFHSVKNGIEEIADNAIVAIHDGVRPLVSISTISRCFQLAAEKGSAIPVLELTESVRQIRDESSVAKDRTLYRLVQTPQIFRSDWLMKAYEEPFQDSFTDDASVIENCGFPVHLAHGNEENIKITTPKDLKIAEALFDLDLE